MGKWFTAFTGALALALPIALATPEAARAACPAELLIGWEDWNPYQFKDAEGKLTGLDVELATAIVEGAGCTLAFRELPWKRHLKDVESGAIHLAAGASKTEERIPYAHFELPYRTESMVLFVRRGEAGRWRFSSLKDIIGTDFKLGGTIGYYYGEEFEALKEDPGFKANLELVKSDQLNYQKLAKGRIHGLLADPFTAAVALRAEGMAGAVEVHPVKVFRDDTYLMASKKAVPPELLAQLKASLDKLKAGGVVDAIMKKYLE